MDLLVINEVGEVNGSVPLDDLAAEVCRMVTVMYQARGFQIPWTGYLARRNHQYVGTCAFKSAPVNGRVEISYFTFPPFENQGVATTMAASLIEIAQGTDASLQVYAHTLPQASASTKLLGNLGFRYTRELQHPEDGPVWEWVLYGS